MLDNEERPLVSVALITYNHVGFIGAALESVLSQSYPNFEVIVADDFSTDGTRDVIKRYAVKYPDKIKIASSEINLGVTKNHNRAFSGCAGKYIAWMSGDDIMLPEKLTIQVNYLEKNERCAICYHDLEYFNSDDDSVLYLKSEIDRPRNGRMSTVIKYGCFNGGVSNMIRRGSAPPRGFDERIPIASDWLFWVETLIGGGEIHYIDRVLARHRRHASNVTVLDSRNPSILEIQDHLMSSEVILSSFPGERAAVRYRKAYLYSSLRMYGNGINYNKYLLLSLSHRFRLKVLIGLISSVVLGWRR
jgi:glycosyltransferase involved in cell wall biosynthesis